MDELEGFAVDGTDANFEFGSFGGVDDTADLQAEDFAGEDAVFTDDVCAAVLDEAGELFVGVGWLDLGEMWCGCCRLECAVEHLPDAQVAGEGLGAAGGDAGIAFDDEVDFGQVMLLHPQERGPDGADVVAGHIEGAAVLVCEPCAEGKVLVFGLVVVEADC